MLLDLHIHTKYCGHSDLSVKEIFKTCALKGIVPSITDHNSAKPWKEAGYYSKKLKMDFVKGEEIKVFHENKFVGEILGLFMNEEVASGNLFEVIDSLRSQNAVISVSHPFDVFRKPLFKGFSMLEEIKGKVDAVEAFNSRCYFASANTKAKEFSEKNKISFTAGSDAHFLKELGNAFIITDANSIEEARKKILKHKCSYWGKLSGWRFHFFTQIAKTGILGK